MGARLEKRAAQPDIAREMTHRQNCEALVALLRTTGDKVVELYGVWDGDFANVPQAQENISVDRLLDLAQPHGPRSSFARLGLVPE
jgi:hypothetical protein